MLWEPKGPVGFGICHRCWDRTLGPRSERGSGGGTVPRGTGSTVSSGCPDF